MGFSFFDDLDYSRKAYPAENYVPGYQKCYCPNGKKTAHCGRGPACDSCDAGYELFWGRCREDDQVAKKLRRIIRKQNMALIIGFLGLLFLGGGAWLYLNGVEK